jgi:hypothetical protein
VDAGGRVEVVVVVANGLNGNVSKKFINKIKNEVKKQKKTYQRPLLLLLTSLPCS